MTFFRRSVSSITSSLTGMIKDLEDHAEAMEAKQVYESNKSQEHARRATEAGDEAEKAITTSLRINALLG